MKRSLSIASLALAWSLIVLAGLLALDWLVSIGMLHAVRDFGFMAAKATYSVLWLLPVFISVSVTMMYLSHRGEGTWSHRIYWAFLGTTLFVWLLAISDFAFRPTRGWQLFLGQ